jgi:hypothetical protein
MFISVVIAVGLVAFCAWVTAKVLRDDEDEYESKR